MATPEPIAPSPHPQKVEELLERIDALVIERQALRAVGASALALERNRRKLASQQQQLSCVVLELQEAGRNGGARAGLRRENGSL